MYVFRLGIVFFVSALLLFLILVMSASQFPQWAHVSLSRVVCSHRVT